jgi:formylglycine-generating enzyme required for sulfatase activity
MLPGLVMLGMLAVAAAATVAAGSALAADAADAPTDGAVVRIPAGDFAPLFGLDTGQTALPVADFWVDRDLVTRDRYAAFVAAHPGWRRTAVSALFADRQYLTDWDADRPPEGTGAYPVTWVSWFAASAFCRDAGGRLPTTLEWEYVAAASQRARNAAADPDFVQGILGWYARPSRGDADLGPVGRSPANVFGLRDLHGLVWEWTSDFNASFITADNRADGDRSRSFFCGNGVTGAARRDDYAAFMRYAMRGSLGPTFALGNLGFRCAYDRAPAAAPGAAS